MSIFEVCFAWVIIGISCYFWGRNHAHDQRKAQRQRIDELAAELAGWRWTNLTITLDHTPIVMRRLGDMRNAHILNGAAPHTEEDGAGYPYWALEPLPVINDPIAGAGARLGVTLWALPLEPARSAGLPLLKHGSPS